MALAELSLIYSSNRWVSHDVGTTTERKEEHTIKSRPVGSFINDVTTLGRGRQGFCTECLTNRLKNIENSVTSFIEKTLKRIRNEKGTKEEI